MGIDGLILMDHHSKFRITKFDSIRMKKGRVAKFFEINQLAVTAHSATFNSSISATHWMGKKINN